MIGRCQILVGFLFSVFLNCGFSQITDTSNYKYYRQSIAVDMLMLEDDPADSERWMRVAYYQQKIQDFPGAIESHDMAIRYSPTDYRAVNSHRSDQATQPRPCGRHAGDQAVSVPGVSGAGSASRRRRSPAVGMRMSLPTRSTGVGKRSVRTRS